MSRTTSMIFVVALLLPIGCLAKDMHNMYRNISPTGYESCSDFVAANDECNDGVCMRFAVFRVWLQGYLTSYNLMEPDTYDIAGGKGRDTADKTLEIWLAKYCAQNSSKSFAEAAEALTIEYYPTRLKTMPKE